MSKQVDSVITPESFKEFLSIFKIKEKDINEAQQANLYEKHDGFTGFLTDIAVLLEKINIENEIIEPHVNYLTGTNIHLDYKEKIDKNKIG